jgi:hypothetical protein
MKTKAFPNTQFLGFDTNLGSASECVSVGVFPPRLGQLESAAPEIFPGSELGVRAIRKFAHPSGVLASKGSTRGFGTWRRMQSLPIATSANV